MALKVSQTENTMEISGSLPFTAEGMDAGIASRQESFINIGVVLMENTPLSVEEIYDPQVGNKAAKNAWFICIDPILGYNYSFPIFEGENRDNDFARLRFGLAHFHQKHWKIYKLE